MYRALIAAALLSAACSEDGSPIVVRTVSDQSGAPIAGVLVQVGDQPWQTTDAAGEATFEPASEPFTVITHQTIRASVDVVFELGDRSGELIVAEISEPGPAEWHSAGVSGFVTGQSAPTATVQVGAAPFGDWSTSSPVASDGSFEMGVPWHLAPEVTTKNVPLYAWETDGATPPGHYQGFGRSAPLDLVDDEFVTGVAVALVPVAEDAVAGSVSLPAALAAAQTHTYLWLDFGPYEKLMLVYDLSVPADFTLVAPHVEDAGAWIGLYAGGSWHFRRVTPANPDLTFAPPAPPVPVEPAAGVAIDEATVFRWTPAEPGGSSRVFLTCSWTDAALGDSLISYYLDAQEDEATLPAVPGLAIGAGANCEWGVHWCAAVDPADEERCAEAVGSTP